MSLYRAIKYFLGDVDVLITRRGLKMLISLVVWWTVAK